MTATLLDGKAVAQADPRRARRSRHQRSANGSGARPRSRSCSSATTPRPRSMCATSSRRPRMPAWACTSSACRAPRRSRPCSASSTGFNKDPNVRRHPRPVAAAESARRRTPSSACSTRSIPARTSTASARSPRVASAQNREGFAPCTPAGVIELLVRTKTPIEGKHAVVIGRSDIVGKPMAALLLHKNATVTICHSRTRDLPAMARTADILVAAIGRPAFVTRDFVKPGRRRHRRRHQLRHLGRRSEADLRRATPSA